MYYSREIDEKETIPYPICSVVAVLKMLIRILNTLRSRIWDMGLFLFSVSSIELIVITNLYCSTIFHYRKAMFFIEWYIIFIFGHSFNIEKVLIFFFYIFNHFSSYSFSLILWMNEYIMNLCQHFCIIKYSCKSN